ncbi:MAG: DNA replication/repair protein RecF [Steroidobacteraceae bacterium]|jgi:DNA replication and repair protein RecF
MTLRRMQVTDFRCLHHGDIEFDRRFTLFSGPNAAGKTSVLEAIYVLGRGRSFRTRRLEHLIRAGSERFRVVGETELGGRRVTVGVEASSEGIGARIAGERVKSLADLTAFLPVQIIDPEVHRLIEEGPGRRRRFLDWGVFHVEPTFIGHWQKYGQVLRQRNAALRSSAPRSVVSAWDSELVRYGELVTAARQRYVELLAPIAVKVAAKLLGLELALSLRTGWLRDLGFSQALERSWRQDQDLGSTQVGPQRAELVIKLDGVLARDRISRGQQKLLASVLLIAQIKLFRPDAEVRPILLLDDPAAELDAHRLAAFIGELSAQPLQLVVTTLNQELATLGGFGQPGRRYGLEQGKITNY